LVYGFVIFAHAFLGKMSFNPLIAGVLFHPCILLKDKMAIIPYVFSHQDVILAISHY